MVLFLSDPSRASDGDEEYTLKAAFLYNFSFFIDWPLIVAPSKDENFKLCLWRRDPSDGDFETLNHRRFREGAVELLTVVTMEQVLDKRCHTLFIPARSGETSELGKLAEKPVLTVCDRPLPLCIIEFQLVERKIRFKIYNGRASRAHLVLRSQLLSLALPE